MGHSGNLSTTFSTETVGFRDTNGNITANNFCGSSTSNAAGGTVTLTAASSRTQIFSGAGASTLILPVATGLSNGWTFYVNNNSAGIITIQYQDTTTLITVPRGDYVQVILTSNGTANGTWDYHWLLPANMVNGQVMIGSTGDGPKASTLTAGTGISITNGAGSITVAATGSEVGWNDKAVSFAAASGQGYFVTANATATLPASPSNGDQIEFFVDGAATLILQANTGQKIKFATALSSSAGTMTNTASGDSCIIVYRAADTQWNCIAFVGAWNAA